MRNEFKKLAAKLPLGWQQELKRWYFSWQLKTGNFQTDEKEFPLLESMVRPGDWVLDVGANIGHYSARLSELVGPTGRVIAFEPVPATFELLASNVARLHYSNVTVINAAASDASRSVGMSIPTLDSGLNNYYMARLGGPAADLVVLALSVDSMQLPNTVRLAKIDAEGHEMSVLHGMARLIERDHPTLIIEESSSAIGVFLSRLGYAKERLPGSSNAIYRWAHDL